MAARTRSSCSHSESQGRPRLNHWPWFPLSLLLSGEFALWSSSRRYSLIELVTAPLLPDDEGEGEGEGEGDEGEGDEGEGEGDGEGAFVLPG